MLDILSRLSIKSIFCCKTVCKVWYNLLTSDPLFVNMYHKRSSSNFPSLLLSINDSVRLVVELKADDSHPLKRAIVLSPMFHLPSQNATLVSRPKMGPRCDTAKEEPEGPRSSLLSILHFISLTYAEIIDHKVVNQLN